MTTIEPTGAPSDRVPGARSLDARAQRVSRAWAAPRARIRGASLSAASALMDLVSHLIRRLPPRVRYVPADAVTVPLAHLWPRMRLIERNFAMALGSTTDDPRVRALARQSVRNYGRMAIDFLRVRTMAPTEVLAWCTGVGEPLFNAARSLGRGVIFALPHVGSWDVAAAFAQAYGLKLSVVTESNWVTQLVAGSRTEHGVTLVPRDRSLRLLFRALQRNECVVMLSDVVHEGILTAHVPFFGRPAPFPMGPARLAQHTGAPILVITSVRCPDGSYLIAAGEPLIPDRGRPAEQEIRRLTAAIAGGFEAIIRAHPEQWYPFSRVWNE